MIHLLFGFARTSHTLEFIVFVKICKMKRRSDRWTRETRNLVRITNEPTTSFSFQCTSTKVIKKKVRVKQRNTCVWTPEFTTTQTAVVAETRCSHWVSEIPRKIHSREIVTIPMRIKTKSVQLTSIGPKTWRDSFLFHKCVPGLNPEPVQALQSLPLRSQCSPWNLLWASSDGSQKPDQLDRTLTTNTGIVLNAKRLWHSPFSSADARRCASEGPFTPHVSVSDSVTAMFTGKNRACFDSCWHQGQHQRHVASVTLSIALRWRLVWLGLESERSGIEGRDIGTYDGVPDFVAVRVLGRDEGHHVSDAVALHDGDAAGAVLEARACRRLQRALHHREQHPTRLFQLRPPVVHRLDLS